MIPRSLPVWLLAAATSLQPAFAQTSTKCNPLQQTCPADPALGTSTTIDFTAGSSSQFSESGSPHPSYNSNGVNLVVAESGNSPTLTSDFYMMFGNVQVTMKAASGVGIVSSMVLQSDDLDEIDLEWLGADGNQVQSNYFGKGQTTSYNRGAFHNNPGNQDSYHTYTVDWTSEQTVWQIDGTTVRALTPASAEAGQYPQTPMQLKLGIWSGGDPSNPPGTIQWAGGQTQYNQGPFTMYVQSVKATDYSTGTQYTYSDSTGSWQSIRSTGGTVNSGGNTAASSAAAAAPSVTEVSSGAPSPFGGTHRGSSSTFVTPSVWPWVATSTLATSVQTADPSVPSGWTLSSSGHLVPLSAAPSTAPPSQPSSSPAPSQPPSSPAPAASSSSPEPSPSPAAASGYITTVVYNQQGFRTTLTEPAAWTTAAKSYNQQGFPVHPTGVAINKQTDPTNGESNKSDENDVDDEDVSPRAPPNSQLSPPTAGVSSTAAAAATATTLSTAASASASGSGAGSSSPANTATAVSGSSPSSSSSSSFSSSVTSITTSTTIAPPTSLNATPMAIPTAMGSGAAAAAAGAGGAAARMMGVGAGLAAVGVVRLVL